MVDFRKANLSREPSVFAISGPTRLISFSMLCVAYIILSAKFILLKINDESSENNSLNSFERSPARQLLIHRPRPQQPFDQSRNFDRSISASMKRNTPSSFVEHNRYFNGGRRFWRKNTVLCNYDPEDIALENNSSLMQRWEVRKYRQGIRTFSTENYVLFSEYRPILSSMIQEQAVPGFRRSR
jgi:hypothetical protein